MMFYTNFDDLFDLVWKRWDRPVLEVNGYKILDTDNGKLIVLNALGINKKDLKVSVVGGTLVIEGKTEAKEIDFTNSVSYKFDINRLKPHIEGITYELKDGLAYVNINLKKEKEKEIKIAYKE